MSLSPNAIHQKRHQLRKLRGETAYVDATAARNHLATLLGSGWSIRSVAGVAGVPASTLSRFSRGQQDKAAPKTIAAVLAVNPAQVPAKTNSATAEPFVSRVGTVRRLQALLFMGWGHKQMLAHSVLRTACLVHQQGRWVTRSTHDAVAAMYRDLSHQRGPSTKASTWALRLGYRGPADWHDIDHDADADTVALDADGADEVAVLRFLAGDHTVALTAAERREVVARWPATGRALADIERAGWKPERYRQDGAA